MSRRRSLLPLRGRWPRGPEGVSAAASGETPSVAPRQLPLWGSSRRAGLAAIAAGFLCIAAAADPNDRLPDPAQEARARALFRDVRCLVCQNESIDDSEAELAHDLRQVVRQQVAAGRSDAEIKRFLTDRYGEFVLLTPAFNWTNLALWGGPFLVVVLGAGLLLGRLRNRTSDEELSPEEAARVRRLSETDSA